ncbi:hypothetical protein P3X46_005292 [Hevea brasiliensis]|uniref:TF-B3 domain-containing protein n=1 Tax=Hevea brasiliensis TaxID=3981 RepID=A0ABQ9N4E0_HEVBR|nr:B3 domain-containing protein At5g38490-like [Hevea brasiliensis]KAJ9185694.1 hypothetical protein P3X46_005292 [Hevea brasiliensis]
MAFSSSNSDGEGRKESDGDLLTPEDLKLRNVDTNKKVTLSEALLVVAETASVKWEDEERKKRVEMAKTQRLLREKALKKPIDLAVEKKGIAIENREFTGKKLMGGAIKVGKELNEKKNGSINTALKRRNLGCEKDKNWENDQERRKKHRKGSSERETGKVKGSMPVTPPELPQEFKEKIKEMHGTEVQLVITKTITNTDRKDAQGRLSMPKRQILCEFLKEDEREKLEKNEDMKVKIMIDPNLKLSDMIFKRWNMRKPKGNTSTSFVFRTHWNDLRKKIGVKSGELIQVWSFRVEEKLYFALIRVEEEERMNNPDTSEASGATVSIPNNSPGSCITQAGDSESAASTSESENDEH